MTRKGAIAVYLEPWHQDIDDFIDIKKNSGEERRRAHDIFPALWIPDIFMERVLVDGDWTLFDPYDVPLLKNAYGSKFEKSYLDYELDTNIKKIVVRAKDLWKKILTSYYEVGSPFLCWKDTANRANPNKHKGVIRSSNLCFTGDTIVATADGRNGVSIKQLAEESKGKLKFPVYCAKEDTTRIVPKTINKKNRGWVKTTLWKDEIKEAIAFKTGTKKVITVVLENGDTFRCTHDHELALNNGGYVEAKNSIGKELKGFYTKTNMGPERIINYKHSGLVVVDIIDNNEEEDVYDLTVDDNHNFYIITSTEDDSYLNCNGILVHNCTEIFQNTSPNHYMVKVYVNNGDNYLLFEETDLVYLNTGKSKLAKFVTSLDTLESHLYTSSTVDITDYKQIQLKTEIECKVWCVEKEKIDGKTAVCNLGSVNLAKINTKEDMERVVPIAVEMLDIVIDLNYYPLLKVKQTNMASRSIGLGVMGEAEYLANSRIHFGSQEHIDAIDCVMECFSYNVIKASSELGKIKGNYPDFEGSEWSKNMLPFDYTRDEVMELTTNKYIGNSYSLEEWAKLRKMACSNMRNGYLMAIAPTSSISILVGTTQAIEPVYKRKWYEENLSGLIPVVAPKLSVDTWEFYKPAHEVDQKQLIKVAAIRQKWIDQGQSVNIFMAIEKASGKYLHELYTLAWKLGLKSTYYLRSQSAEASKADDRNIATVDRSIECEGCQ